MDNVENEVVTEEGKTYEIYTSESYSFINENQEVLPYPLLVEFRERLEDILNRNKCVTATFHPLDWKYHKNKCKEIDAYNESWRNTDFGIFRPYYFLRNVAYEGREMYKLMSDEDKMKLSQSLKDEGERDWERWSYESCQLNHPYLLSLETDFREDYEFFFAWQLRGTDLFEIRDFLDWHIINTFQKNRDSLIRFIKILFFKYKEILENDGNKTVVFECLDEIENRNVTVSETNVLVSSTSKSGKPPKDKIIIVKPLDRDKGDKRTIFNREDTAKLFSYLAQLNCIFNTPPDMSKTAFADAINALTGFSAGQIKDFLVYESIVPKNKNEKKKVIENIKSLIIKNLQDDLGGY